jgi:hypothetical protein
MQGSKGTITAHPLYTVHELGFGNTEPYIDRIIRAFLKMGDAIAPRWIQMPKGILFLQVHRDDPASGAIYVYDRQKQQFFLLEFAGDDEHLTVEDFSKLLPEYNLLRFAEQPALLHASCQTVA